MGNLKGKVAVVTGASRGVGRGIAGVLAEEGAAVYVSGRTATRAFADAPAAIHAIDCDHTRDDDVARLFDRIAAEAGRIDLLVNNVWGGSEALIDNGEFTWALPFWSQGPKRWDAMFAAGVRAHYVASSYAARLMVEQRGGLIVNLSYWAAQKYMGNVAYGVAKAATDKLASDMACELREHGVASVALYPGLVRTEKIMELAALIDLSNSESPAFVGRAVAALAADREVMRYTGQVLLTAQLALDYGFTEIDGKLPAPLTLESA